MPFLLDPSTVVVLYTMTMMQHVPHVTVRMGIGVETTSWIDDNVARRFWNCKNSLKDDELEEGYYKDQLHKMRFKLRRTEDHSEIAKEQKKLVKLQKEREAEKEACNRELMEVKKKNSLMKSYLGTAKCLILFLVIGMWLKCA
ncbi:unnamed protein product [Lactuca saligna]|uniref:Uncharacterized protein n=1 Tax=Lactuca saligna TaxID=75948 RepID=A0AA35UJV1_LACSI|nr:unnamed protein product [Lactuca saligna]